MTTSRAQYTRTCSFCRKTGSVWGSSREIFKYSVRHYAHAPCLAEAKGDAEARTFIVEHQREQFDKRLKQARAGKKRELKLTKTLNKTLPPAAPGTEGKNEYGDSRAGRVAMWERRLDDLVRERFHVWTDAADGEPATLTITEVLEQLDHRVIDLEAKQVVESFRRIGATSGDGESYRLASTAGATPDDSQAVQLGDLRESTDAQHSRVRVDEANGPFKMTCTHIPSGRVADISLHGLLTHYRLIERNTALIPTSRLKQSTIATEKTFTKTIGTDRIKLVHDEMGLTLMRSEKKFGAKRFWTAETLLIPKEFVDFVHDSLAKGPAR